MMRENVAKKLWRENEIAINAWLAIPNSWSAEIVASVGFDVVTIDMQHGLIGYQNAVSMLQSISSTNAQPIVRVPWNDPAMIMKVLDAGAMGVICPMINTKEEAQKFVGACRYPPLGYRSYGPLRASLYVGDEYSQHNDEHVVTLAMIETVEAVENIDEILSANGLDGIYIGTMDLSISLGIEDRGEITNPILSEAINKILSSVKQYNLVAGMHTRSVEDTSKMKELGFKLITPMNDSKLLLRYSTSKFKETQDALTRSS
ncbi:MAG: HpcH/HpaI aldolase family protein [Candidatus Kariarchaeaceae archaeon]|jgi:4-hydroxy-2-oxoheptanedioate aldolase